MEEYKNELLDEWVGKIVLVKRLLAPELDEDFAKKIAENPKSMRNQLLASYTHACVLKGYDRIGIVLEVIADDPETILVPWGSVIELSHLTDRPWSPPEGR